MIPTMGRVVIYRLSELDAVRINRRLDDAERVPPGPNGHVLHIGNRVEAYQDHAAIVVRTFGSPDEVNLQVLLDGNHTYWATSATEGREGGQWHWPERV